MKKKIQGFLESILFVLLVLLVFLTLFANKLAVPYWLQPLGRMHPLVLHFPIVLLLLYALLEWFHVALEIPEKAITATLLIASITATFTAIAGLLLSTEPGYDGDLLQTHKWFGLAATLMAAAIYFLNNLSWFRKPMMKGGAALVSLCLIAAGHFGAGVTHGADFLFAPINAHTPENDTIRFEHAAVYDHIITPVLKSKCYSCHNATKRKGKLDLTTKAGFLKGSEDGLIVNHTDLSASKLLQVIQLPVGDDKHMPPDGKPQLTMNEMLLLKQWVREGADMAVKIQDMNSADTLRQLADAAWKSHQHQTITQQYKFDAASSDKVAKLNSPNRSVVPIANESPALKVTFYNKGTFNNASLSELSSVATNVVELDLHNMPIKDSDLISVGTFSNLETLNLNYTDITATGLKQLQSLKNLQRLSLSGTSVGAEDIRTLSTVESLKELYVWNTKVRTDDLHMLQQQFKKVTFQTGFTDDGAILKLPPPRLTNGSNVFSKPIKITLFSPIKGTDIRYNLNSVNLDSIHSSVYPAEGIPVHESAVIKTQAFKKGWKKSDALTFLVLRNAFAPDAISFLQAPNPRYNARGAQSLIDHELAVPSIWHPGWVGFHDHPMELILHYPKPVDARSVSLSCYLDIGSYIFPPEKVEVWGGDDVNHLHLITSVAPVQPVKDSSTQPYLLNYTFKAQRLSVIKVMAKPIQKLPAWHPGKGQRGHFFVDEIGVN